METLATMNMEDVEMGRTGPAIFPDDEELNTLIYALQTCRPYEDMGLSTEEQTHLNKTRLSLLENLGLLVS